MKPWRTVAACLALGLAAANWSVPPAMAKDPAQIQAEQMRKAQAQQLRAQREAARQAQAQQLRAQREAGRRGASDQARIAQEQARIAREQGHRVPAAPGRPGCFWGVGYFGGGC
jgi:hypothetical protein